MRRSEGKRENRRVKRKKYVGKVIVRGRWERNRKGG